MQRGDTPPDLQADPLGWLAEAAGYSDGERWWEHMVEQRRDGEGLFEAILEAMTAVRQAAGYEPATHFEACREAYMRQTIRAAQREGFERIAVVCGAWHAPALAEMPPARKDAALLKGLPRVKVAATWIPWTYGRLAYASGYGAGILSPGWYTHLWECEGEVATRWLARVAALLREQDLDAAPASVIESVRLAEALAALRDRPLPSLPELMEATQAVLCFGSDLPLRLIARRLIVGERLGQVPPETPMVPLQQDLIREQKRLRLSPSPEPRDLELDLRQPTGLDRSRLLHRLNLLGVRWGQVRAVSGARGTFREAWRLEWQPEFAVVVIEANRYGSTLEAAATACAREAADAAGDLPTLTQLLDQCLLADLPEAVQHALDRIQAEAALSSDVGRLLEALPPLAHIQRYGSVRQTDAALAAQVAAGLLTRACIGLPGACASLNDEAAAEMYERLVAADEAVRLLPAPEHQAAWTATLARLAEQAGVHGLVAGRCCRLLHEQGALPEGDLARHTHRALSRAVEPAQAAAWVEGLLKGGAMLLLHDDALWTAVDAWLTEVPPAAFTQVAPLLRRTFATFSPPERREMGERARRGLRPAARATRDADLDTARAEAVLPLIRQLLGRTDSDAGLSETG